MFYNIFANNSILLSKCLMQRIFRSRCFKIRDMRTKKSVWVNFGGSWGKIRLSHLRSKYFIASAILYPQAFCSPQANFIEKALVSASTFSWLKPTTTTVRNIRTFLRKNLVTLTKFVMCRFASLSAYNSPYFFPFRSPYFRHQQRSGSMQ